MTCNKTKKVHPLCIILGITVLLLVMLSSIASALPPKANFNYEINGLKVKFTDTSTNKPTMWHWSFGDNKGSNSVEKNPSFTYPKAGSYNVTLTVANGDGNDSITKKITVKSTNNTIPEFPSYAVPVVAMLGIFFILGRRIK